MHPSFFPTVVFHLANFQTADKKKTRRIKLDRTTETNAPSLVAIFPSLKNVHLAVDRVFMFLANQNSVFICKKDGCIKEGGYAKKTVSFNPVPQKDGGYAKKTRICNKDVAFIAKRLNEIPPADGGNFDWVFSIICMGV